MLSPEEIRTYIKKKKIPFGQNVVFHDTIDTSRCEEFFGTRCPGNVHVTSRHRAHVDRVDPRKGPIEHLRRDVGIPYFALTAPSLAAIGGLIDVNNRKRGIALGLGIGFVLGLIADIAST